MMYFAKIVHVDADIRACDIRACHVDLSYWNLPTIFQLFIGLFQAVLELEINKTQFWPDNFNFAPIGKVFS